MSYLLNVFAIAKIVFYPSWIVSKYLFNWIEFSEEKRKLLKSPDLRFSSPSSLCNSVTLGRSGGERTADLKV